MPPSGEAVALLLQASNARCSERRSLFNDNVPSQRRLSMRPQLAAAAAAISNTADSQTAAFAVSCTSLCCH